MIISRIEGGLGNQLFQYAYGSYLAQQHDTELYLDLSTYETGPQHGYLLDHFAITAKPVSPSQSARIPRRYRSQSYPSNRSLWNRFAELRRHKESPFGFEPRHLQTPDQRYLVGYWQSEQFFPGMRRNLLDQFQLRETLSEPSKRIAERIRSTVSVALHIRRGDYLTNASAAKLYCSLPLDYYRSCLHQWAADRTGVEVFVFSNDISWCRQHLDLPWKTHWVDHTTAETAHEDMVLMSQAACCVIANSTFSWWSAWLNQRPKRTIYAPPVWFQPGTMDDSNIIPTDWTSASNGIKQAA